MKEKWKKVKEFTHYRVSNLGRVKSLKHISTIPEKIIKPFNIGRGYVGVTLYHYGRFKAVPIHKLVTDAFLGKCPKIKEVNHKNGKKNDPRLDNLEYISHLENVHHNLNLRKKAILSKKNIRKIRRYLSKDYSIRKIASEFNVSASTICDIRYGRTWGWLK